MVGVRRFVESMQSHGGSWFGKETLELRSAEQVGDRFYEARGPVTPVR